MSYNYEAQKARNRAHLDNPEPGDSRHEMFPPVCLVLAVTPDSMTICKTTKQIDREHYTFDIKETETISLSEFIECKKANWTFMTTKEKIIIDLDLFMKDMYKRDTLKAVE